MKVVPPAPVTYPTVQQPRSLAFHFGLPSLYSTGEAFLPSIRRNISNAVEFPTRTSNARVIMESLARAAVSGVWIQASQRQALSTPDKHVSRQFQVVVADGTRITIQTEGGSPIAITREAFVAAVQYLAEHGHDVRNPCEIRSNQLAESAGPLCAVTREQNGGTRVINYIAPILASVGLVAIDSDRPNSVWLV